MNLRPFCLLFLSKLLCAQFSPEEALKTGKLGGKTIRYQVANGHAAIGDVLLAKIGSDGTFPQASVSLKIWTNGVIPYVLDAGFAKKERMLNAIRQWQESTGLQFVERSNQTNYLRLVSPPLGCNSFVGMKGGEQVLNLSAGCSDGAAVHELGHAIGLFHEHTRLDRSQWVQIVKDNIIATCPFESDFGLVGGSKDLGSYDFGSVMHYDGWASTRNGYPTIVTIPANIPIGEAVTKNTGPSEGDIETVRRLYGKPPRGTTITTFPVGLPIVVDGVSYTAPRTFNWPAGSRHTIGSSSTIPVNESTRLAFARWSDNGASEHSVNANVDFPVYTASFVRYFKVTAAASPAGTASIRLDPPSGDGFYPEGSYVRVQAEAAAGRSFYRWDGLEAFPLSVPEEAGDIFEVNPRSFHVSKPKVFSAITLAGENLVTVNTDPPNLRVEVDGLQLTGPTRTFWTPGSKHRLTVNDPVQPSRGGLVEFYTRYVFTGWVGGNGRDSGIDVVGPDFSSGPVTYTAKFKRQFQADVGVFSGGTVEIEPKTVDGYFDENQVVKFTPKPAPGNRFFDWFGLPASLDAQFFSDAPTNNVCASPLVYKMDRPILAKGQMTAPLTNGPRPLVAADAVRSAASGAGGGVAPGEILVLYGQNLGPKDLVPGNLSPAGQFDNCLARSIVYFDGIAAPLLYGSGGQVSAIAPYSLAGKSSTQVVVEFSDVRSAALTLPVVAAKPAFFTANSSGRGAGAFLDLNYQLITSQNPAIRGGYAQLFATGGGQTDPPGLDGALVLDFLRLPKLTQPVRVYLGGIEAEVIYAGPAPGAVAGLLQVNIRIPEGAPKGTDVPISLQIGAVRSPDGVSIALN